MVVLICLNVCNTSVQSKVTYVFYKWLRFAFEFHFDFLYPQPFSSYLKIEAGVGSALIDLWAAGQVTKMKGSREQ